MAFPPASKGDVISKACRIVTMLMNNELSAKYFPGQILERECQR